MFIDTEAAVEAMREAAVGGSAFLFPRVLLVLRVPWPLATRTRGVAHTRGWLFHFSFCQWWTSFGSNECDIGKNCRPFRKAALADWRRASPVTKKKEKGIDLIHRLLSSLFLGERTGAIQEEEEEEEYAVRD